MRPLRFHLNLTLDGCYDHTVGIPDEELHLNAMRFIAEADIDPKCKHEEYDHLAWMHETAYGGSGK